MVLHPLLPCGFPPDSLSSQPAGPARSPPSSGVCGTPGGPGLPRGDLCHPCPARPYSLPCEITLVRSACSLSPSGECAPPGGEGPVQPDGPLGPARHPAPGTESVRPGYLRSESSGRRNQACPRALGISRSEPQPSRHSDPRRVVTAVRVRYRHRGPGFSLGHTQPAAPALAGSCAQPGAHSRSAGCRLFWWGVFGRAGAVTSATLPPAFPQLLSDLGQRLN